MPPQDLLDDEQPQPRTFLLLGHRLAETLELHEKAGLVLLRDPRARVLHVTFDKPVLFGHAYFPAALLGEFQSVAQEVREHLGDGVGVEEGLYLRRGIALAELYVPALGPGGEAGYGFFGQRDHVLHGLLEARGPGFEPRHLQDLADDPVQALGVLVGDAQQFLLLFLQARAAVLEDHPYPRRDRGERRAQLVGDQGGEIVLQLFHLPAFGYIPRHQDHALHLSGGQHRHAFQLQDALAVIPEAGLLGNYFLRFRKSPAAEFQAFSGQGGKTVRQPPAGGRRAHAVLRGRFLEDAVRHDDAEFPVDHDYGLVKRVYQGAVALLRSAQIGLYGLAFDGIHYRPGEFLAVQGFFRKVVLGAP